MSTSIRHRIEAAGIAYPVNWSDMGSSARDLWEDRQIAALDRKSAAAEPLPELRVRDFLAKHREYNGRDYIAYDGMGSSYHILYVHDLQDVLNELAAARKAADAAQAEVSRWREMVAALSATVDRLSEQLADYVDPAPQGDPIETEND